MSTLALAGLVALVASGCASGDTEDPAPVDPGTGAEEDPGGEDSNGDGVVYEITLQDYGNIHNPAVDYSTVGTSGVTASESSVTVDGSFDDVNTGDTVTITVDGVCAG